MKKILLLAVVALSCLYVMAQEKKQLSEEEKMEGRVKRMQQELMLDDNASEKFATIYKDYLTDMKKAGDEMQESRKALKEKRKAGTLKDSDIKSFQKQQLANEKKMVELREKYYDKFGKVLNARQVDKVMFAKPGKGPRGNGGQGFRGQDPRGSQFGGEGPQFRGPAPEGSDSIKPGARQEGRDRFGMPRMKHNKDNQAPEGATVCPEEENAPETSVGE